MPEESINRPFFPPSSLFPSIPSLANSLSFSYSPHTPRLFSSDLWLSRGDAVARKSSAFLGTLLPSRPFLWVEPEQSQTPIPQLQAGGLQGSKLKMDDTRHCLQEVLEPARGAHLPPPCPQALLAEALLLSTLSDPPKGNTWRDSQATQDPVPPKQRALAWETQERKHLTSSPRPLPEFSPAHKALRMHPQVRSVCA